MRILTLDNRSLLFCARACLLVLSLLSAFPVARAQMGYVWCKTIQSPGWDDAGMDVDCDAQGNIFIGGDYSNNANFGGTPYISWGGSDMYASRMDAQGNFQWVHTVGSMSTDRTFGVRAGVDGHIYAAGYGKVTFPVNRVALHAWDAITMRIRPDGSLHWGWSMNGGGSLDFSESLDIAPDVHGNSYTVGVMKNDGWYDTDTVHGIGLEDAFIVKFDSTGDFQWGQAFGGSQNDQANGVDVDAQGNVWVGGTFRGNATFGGIPLGSAGGSDAFIAKVDPGGNVLFARHIHGLSNSEVIRLKLSDDGDCYFAGIFAGTITVGSQQLTAADTLDIFYGKLDAAGNFLWAMQAGGFDMDFVQDMEIDAEENVYLGGYFFGDLTWQGQTINSMQYDDFYFAKTDSNGQLGLLVAAHDPDSRDIFGLAVDPAQNIILTGLFADTLTLGSPTYTSTLGTFDIFVAKYATRLQQIAIVEVLGSPYCSSDQFDVVFDAWGNFDPGNIFHLELSDASGSFAAPVVIGSLAGSFGGTITGTIPLGISQGTQYRVRIRSTMPALISPDNGQDIALDPSTAVAVEIFGDTVLCDSLPVVLSVNPALSQQVWSTGDTTTAITVLQPGTVWVEATDSNGCSNRDEVTVTVCVGIADEAPSPSIRLFPNPNSGQFHLAADHLAPGQYALEILDSQGRGIHSMTVNLGRGRAVLPVHLPACAAGMYVARLTGAESRAQLRFAIQ